MAPNRTSPPGFIPRPFLILFECYILGIVLFFCYRLGFFLTFRNAAAGASLPEITRAFVTGWRFDTIVVLLALAPLVVFLPWLSLRNDRIRRVVIGYVAAVFSVAFFALLADIRFYKYFDSHLNFQVVQYLGGGNTTWHVVVTDPLFWRLIGIWLLVSLLIVAFVRTMFSRSRDLPDRKGWASQVAWFLVVAALCAVGIRGRLALSPIDWGVAFGTKNPFLNELGLNGIYTLGRALTEEGSDPRLVYLKENQRFPFIPREAALDTVRAMVGEANDEWLEPGRSLLRRTSNPERFGFRPNIVLVVMESWSGRNTGCLGNNLGLTPSFDELASHGLLFTQFYAGGTRTNYGLGATICSFPSLPGRSILSRYKARHPFIALSEILKQRGFKNVFAYGGDLVFDNMQGFLTTKGYDRFYGDKDFGLENVFAKWGIPDHIVFQKSVALADSLPRPFQLTILTLSNHEPFDLPDSSVQKFYDSSDSSKIYNAQRYADHAIGQFMQQFRTSPVFDSTIFVFVADHCKWLLAAPSPQPIQFHIPLLIYAPSLLGDQGKQVSVVGGQVDILPTLMGILGGTYDQASWGRDLLRTPPGDSGWATLNVLTNIGLVEDRHAVAEALGLNPTLHSLDSLPGNPSDISAEEPEVFRRLVTRLHAYMQAADQMSTPTTQDKGAPTQEPSSAK